ncbi:MAG: hypothetical protein Fur0026_13240 [Sideroxydans sp.]
MQAGPEKHRRLFFALWPRLAERAALAAWQAPLHELCGGKPMRPDTLHCTLVFLGGVAEYRLEALCRAAREVAFREFALTLAAAHYWGHNHIVYAAPSTLASAHAALVQTLEHALRKHRFHFEARPYRAHVTLLRHAQWSDTPLPPLPAVRWRVADFALVQSLSDGQGARYEVLCRFNAQG